MSLTETACAEDFPTIQTPCEIFMLVKMTRTKKEFIYKRFLSSKMVILLYQVNVVKTF